MTAAAGLAASHTAFSQPPIAGMPEAQRLILHADLDAFYASVEQRDDPALRGRPVVVGGSAEGRGVVAAASYEARHFGIHSAMAMRTALRLCPSVVRVSPRFAVYGAVSAEVMAIFRAITPLVEPLSLDEAYLDISSPVAAGTEARALASQLKQDVRDRVGLAISVGVAGTRSAAKVASELQKPDGLVVVPPGGERAFLAPLPVAKLWGVGPKAEERLRRYGVRTIGQLAELDRTLLSQQFGRWGELMADLARGIDTRPVTPNHDIKSVGRETTFGADIGDREQLRTTLAELSAEVAERLQRRSLSGRTVTLKVRRHDFSTRTRQATLTVSVHEAGAICALAWRLLEAEFGEGDRLRLIGVTVSGFAEHAQLPLFPLDAAG